MYVAVKRSLLLNTISNALVHESLCSSVFSQYVLIDRNRNITLAFMLS